MAHRTHGLSRTHEYYCWMSMRTRCLSPIHHKYKDYGGRGITICERWRDSFENFLSDMGPRPSPKHSIDRIDNDGDYEPGNCRWALPHIQHANKRRDPRCKLTDEQAREVVRLAYAGYKVSAIAAQFSVVEPIICRILYGRCYRFATGIDPRNAFVLKSQAISAAIAKAEGAKS